MNRRGFIRIMTAASGAMLVAGISRDRPERSLSALEGWHGPKATEDIRMLVLSYALLAPNPHNKQSWIVDLKGPGRFELYVDPARLLPDTDPPFRQIHIGQGTFLENLSLAAAHFGHRAEIQYFPVGMYGNTVLEHKPVASIDLTPQASVERDPLFDAIARRQSNKRVFLAQPLSAMQLDGVRAVMPSDTSDFYLGIAADVPQRQRLAEFAVASMRIEVADQARIAESVAMFRFSDEELELHRDGFGVAQMGAQGARKYLIEKFFISRKSFLAPDSSFGAQSIEGTRGQAESAAAFGWLVSKNNTRYDQVIAGRIYNRIHLTATTLGIAMHPMSQVLQEYSAMTALQAKFKAYLGVPGSHTVQMFFRLGVAEPVRHTARRAVRDIVLVQRR